MALNGSKFEGTLVTQPQKCSQGFYTLQKGRLREELLEFFRSFMQKFHRQYQLIGITKLKMLLSFDDPKMAAFSQ
jgi:hypothetical protein